MAKKSQHITVTDKNVKRLYPEYTITGVKAVRSKNNGWEEVDKDFTGKPLSFVKYIRKLVGYGYEAVQLQLTYGEHRIYPDYNINEITEITNS